jgi:hypothetical protein
MRIDHLLAGAFGCRTDLPEITETGRDRGHNPYIILFDCPGGYGYPARRLAASDLARICHRDFG